MPTPPGVTVTMPEIECDATIRNTVCTFTGMSNAAIIVAVPAIRKQ